MCTLKVAIGIVVHFLVVIAIGPVILVMLRTVRTSLLGDATKAQP